MKLYHLTQSMRLKSKGQMKILLMVEWKIVDNFVFNKCLQQGVTRGMENKASDGGKKRGFHGVKTNNG